MDYTNWTLTKKEEPPTIPTKVMLSRISTEVGDARGAGYTMGHGQRCRSSPGCDNGDWGITHEPEAKDSLQEPRRDHHKKKSEKTAWGNDNRRIEKYTANPSMAVPEPWDYYICLIFHCMETTRVISDRSQGLHRTTSAAKQVNNHPCVVPSVPWV